jgi:hypothetical protein
MHCPCCETPIMKAPGYGFYCSRLELERRARDGFCAILLSMNRREAERILAYVMDRLREERERQGLTLQKFGQISGVRRLHLARISPLSIAANPDAPVIVIEGEKSVDAAARIFPKSAAVTSPGGSQAAAKADWAPLAGRRVLIWPDADPPGEKYALNVVTILQGLRCEVSIIDAVALVSLDPNGGQREPVRGWDAADAAAEWQRTSRRFGRRP